MVTKKIVAVGVLVVAASTIAGGVAVAASRKGADPEREQRKEREYTQAHLADAAVTQAQAEQAAAATHIGTLSDTHLESEGHGLRWEVKVDDGRQLWEVQVDATTGTVVSDKPDD